MIWIIYLSPHLFALLQQEFQPVFGPLCWSFVPLSLILPLRVVQVDAQVQHHAHQDSHKLHGWWKQFRHAT